MPWTLPVFVVCGVFHHRHFAFFVMSLSRPFFLSSLSLSSFSSSLHSLHSLPFDHQLLGSLGLSLLWYGLGGGIIFQNGKFICYYPSLLYDVIQHIFYPLNYFFGILCYILPTRNSAWSEVGYETKRLIGTGNVDIKSSLLREIDQAYNEEDLVLLFDKCPAVSADVLIGNTWNGRIVRTNRSLLDIADWLLVRPLNLLGFQWGKRYRTQHTGDPLLVRWLNSIYFPLPIWGNVGMVNITWRGISTATMNYDYQPWKDYFRLLSDENGKLVLLGVWCHRDVAGGWFTLTLAKDVPT
jgi:hypothetical protein